MKEVWCAPCTSMTGAGEGGEEDAEIATQLEGLQAQRPCGGSTGESQGKQSAHGGFFCLFKFSGWATEVW